MSQYRYILEPYNGLMSRHKCPVCEKDKAFTLYIDTESNKNIDYNVGKCSRLVKCGYHFTPKQFFSQNKGLNYLERDNHYMSEVKSKTLNPVKFLTETLLKNSLTGYTENSFIKYLIKLFGVNITNELIGTYFIGSSRYWAGATVFWQIDTLGKIRTGKIMLYDKETGKRVKTPYNHITWVHTINKTDNFELTQCLFGEHLLKSNLTKHVAIVESEKTAIIASIYLPHFIWIAVGSFLNLTLKRLEILFGRHVTLFPDLNCFDKWTEKSIAFKGLMNISVSDLLENKASSFERKLGLDLADYLIRFNIKDFISPNQKNSLVYCEEKQPNETEINKPQTKLNNNYTLKSAAYYPTYKKQKLINWDDQINLLEKFFKENTILHKTIRLNPCTNIINVSRFIASSLSILKKQNGNPNFSSFLDMLLDLKVYVQSSDKN